MPIKTPTSSKLPGKNSPALSPFSLQVLGDQVALRKMQVETEMDEETTCNVGLARMLADAVFFVSMYKDAIGEPLESDSYDVDVLLKLLREDGEDDPMGAFNYLQCYFDYLPDFDFNPKGALPPAARHKHLEICGFVPSIQESVAKVQADQREKLDRLVKKSMKKGETKVECATRLYFASKMEDFELDDFSDRQLTSQASDVKQ